MHDCAQLCATSRGTSYPGRPPAAASLLHKRFNGLSTVGRCFVIGQSYPPIGDLDDDVQLSPRLSAADTVDDGAPLLNANYRVTFEGADNLPDIRRKAAACDWRR